MDGNDIVKKMAVDNLMQAITGADCYKTYTKAREAVESEPELLKLIMEYKELNFTFNIKKLNGQTPSFDEHRHVSDVYWKLMLNDNAKAYLEAEKTLAKLMQGIFVGASEETGINIRFYI